MKSIFNLVTAASFCAAIATPSANAEPLALSNAELDRVAAGLSCARYSDCYPYSDPFAIPPIAPGGPGPALPPGCAYDDCPSQPPLTPAFAPRDPIGLVFQSGPLPEFSFQFAVSCGPASACFFNGGR